MWEMIQKCQAPNTELYVEPALIFVPLLWRTVSKNDVSCATAWTVHNKNSLYLVTKNNWGSITLMNLSCMLNYTVSRYGHQKMELSSCLEFCRESEGQGGLSASGSETFHLKSVRSSGPGTTAHCCDWFRLSCQSLVNRLWQSMMPLLSF